VSSFYHCKRESQRSCIPSRSIPDPQHAITASRKYTGIPHIAGSDGDFKTAEIFLSHLQKWFNITSPQQKPIYDAGSRESQEATRGIIERDAPSAWIDTYYPVMNTPVGQALQILDDDGLVAWEFDLKEHGDEGDPDAAKYANAVPTFHGYSVSGDVTGHLVDGKYCTKDVS
jgi:N-acetylated-alpha-linked acidic dipeptidase